jgi:Ca-activated chloride channel family protein
LENTPDANKVAPPITPKGTRTGANIDLTVNINAGAPIQEFASVLHKVRSNRQGKNGMRVTLAKADEIPNRDFILRYSVSTDSVQDGFIGHMGDKGGFFTLFLMPPKQATNAQIMPKEIIFVMDQSGSQSGFPIEKSKELTLKLIKTLNPADTFNIIGFNTAVNSLWREPHLNTPRNIAEAETFIKGLQANGGTRLRAAAVAALEGQSDPDRLRIVVFNTDGYVGDEGEILKSIHDHRNHARMFTFGIGNSVNRYLLDEMSIAGRGDVEIVTLAEAADGAVDRFTARSTSPVLTDVTVAFEGIQVDEVLPAALPDVFSERPVMITGRYRTPGKGSVTVSGKLGGRPWSRNIEVDFPGRADAPAIESIWARKKVDELTRHTFLSQILPESERATEEQIVDVALEFGIMTQFTSFVAVEKRIVNVGGKQRTVAVPVEMADGVSYEGVFGADKRAVAASMPAPQTGALYRGGAVGGGGAGGYGGSAGKAMENLSFDPTDNSVIVRGTGGAEMTPEEKRTFRYETRVEKQLRETKGKVEIEVWLKKVDKAIVEKLKKLGLSVDFQDEGLRVLIGTCEAKKLIELAQVDEVDRIRKLKT